MRAPLTIMGGKRYMLKHILPLIPKHTTYIEVFAGAALLFFAKEPSSVEVLNDIDDNITNFYTVLRNYGKATRLFFLANLTPHSRSAFIECRTALNICDNDVMRAWRFFVLARQCFSGRIKSPSWSKSVQESTGGMANAVHQWLSSIERLPEAHQRLKAAHIEHNDFRKILAGYDRKGSFFYIDPPYILDTRYGNDKYSYEMSDDDHRDLVDILLRLEGKALVSGYDHDIYTVLETHGWEKRVYAQTSFAAARTRQTGLLGEGCIKSTQKRQECLWLNYTVP